MGRKILRKLAILVAVVLVAIVFIVIQRHWLIITLATTGEQVQPLYDAYPVPGGTPFVDDRHFSVVQLDSLTFAIAEPHSWARNVNYLMLGERRALLFDAGVGHYDIRPVVASLTDLPVTFMPSHFHYDHTGQGNWERMALVDLPHVRERANGNTFQPSWQEHLGRSEALAIPVWRVDEWVKPGSSIDLGGRELVLIYTPGHTNNSVSLLDVSRQLMFTGDFYSGSGELSAFLPTANLGDYLQSAEKVLDRTRSLQDAVFRGAHAPPVNTIPKNSRNELVVFRDQLHAMRNGSLQGDGAYPVVYRISPDLTLSTEPDFLQNWQPTYPDDHAVNNKGYK